MTRHGAGTRPVSGVGLPLAPNARRVGATLAALLAAACGGSTDSSANPATIHTLSSITVSLGSSTLSVGQGETATATGLDQAGQTIGLTNLTWSSSPTSVASISSSGAIAAIAPGSAIITASSNGKSGSATVTVLAVPVARVTVTSSTALVTVGQAIQLAANAFDASNNTLAGRTVTWRSSAPSVAMVSDAGLLSAVASGTTSITATIDGVSGSTTITVAGVVVAISAPPAIALGDAVQLTATVHDENTSYPNAAITWTSSDTTRAVVSASGLMITRTAGTVTLSASALGAAGTSILTIGTAPAVASCKLPAQFTSVGLGFPRVANRLRSTGIVRATVIFVDFPDAPAAVTPQSVLNSLTPAAEQFYSAISYGNLTLQLNANLQWFRMSKPSSQYGWSALTFALHKAYIQEAVSLADATTDFSQTDEIVVMAPPSATNISNGPTLAPGPGQGFTLDGRVIENAVTSGADLNAWPSGGWLSHEMGHSMGLVDLYAFNPAPLSTHHFVGTFSRMGFINGKAPGYFAWERWVLGWLQDSQIYCTTGTTSTVGLASLESQGGTKAVVIPTGTTTAFVVEYRAATAEDAALPSSGLLVYSIDTSIPSGTGVVKVLPIADADADKSGLILGIGSSITVGAYTVKNLGVVGGRTVVQVVKP